MGGERYGTLSPKERESLAREHRELAGEISLLTWNLIAFISNL